MVTTDSVAELAHRVQGGDVGASCLVRLTYSGVVLFMIAPYLAATAASV